MDQAPGDHGDRYSDDPDEFLWQILTDAAYRDLLALALDVATPPSILAGRPLPGPGEVLWLPEDLEQMVAFQRYRRECCPHCGMHPRQWPRGYRPVDRPYDVEFVLCHPCDAISAERHRRDTEAREANKGLRAARRDIDWSTLRPVLHATGRQPIIPDLSDE